MQLQKENLRLHLSGNTALDRVEITQPCRITRDNSFKGTLGTLVIDLAKTSGREIQIEVPAERVEILSRANVVLGADVERLILGEDAEGTQLAIQRGAAVGRLTADAKVKLTGSGTVSTLEVSVSGVTVDKSLTVKKTETENGAKAPSTASGGSSGGGRSLKVITGAVPVAVRVDYGTDADAALAALPTTVTLNLRDGSTVDATVTAWNWAEQGKYSPTGTAAEYTAEGTFTVPSGCTYSGTPVVKATVTVKPLNMDAFTAALTAAQAKLAGFTEESVAAEATDPDTIYVLPAGTGESDVTNDVKFIFAGNAAYTALKTAVAKAEPYTAGSEKFGSQAACDALTAELTAAADGIGSLAVMTGKNYTDAYIRAQIKKWLDEKKETQKENQADLWAISDAAWPLKYNQEYNRMYQLPQATDAMQVSANGAAAAVALTWTIETSDWDWQKYLEITKDSKTDSVKSVRVTQTPTEPQNITFEVSADGYGDIGTYTVTVGAPIALEAPASPLQFLTSDTRTFQLPLRGASAVKSVPETWGDQALTIAGKIYPEKDLGTISINVAQIDNVEKSKDGKGLDLTVTAATGFVGGAWNPGNNPLACAKGELINISINTSGFKLKTREEGNPGWYLPEALRLDSINVQVLFPVFTEVERAADTDTYNFKIHTENMPLENADIYVAFTLKGNSSNTISGEGTPATYKSNGVYLASFNKTDFKSGQEYSVWCRLGADWVGPEDGGYWFG